MEQARREQLADAAAEHLDSVLAAVEASWPQLVPASQSWSPVARRRARQGAASALRGLIEILRQGDLDERSWTRTQRDVHAHGRATSAEAADLLRSVRIVGVEALAEELRATVTLSREERWELQRQAAVFADELLGDFGGANTQALDVLLEELHASGPDLA